MYKEREKNSHFRLAFTLELQNVGLHPREPNHLGHVGLKACNLILIRGCAFYLTPIDFINFDTVY